jgi:hypothetical protein
VPDPRGGVRHVIPGKGNYLSQEPAAEQKSRLVKGGEHDPLLPYLSEELTRAQRADIAVGFAMRSGVVRMEEHLRDFLDRGGRLRLLTGDYLGITDPDRTVSSAEGNAKADVAQAFESLFAHPATQDLNPRLDRPLPGPPPHPHPTRGTGAAPRRDPTRAAEERFGGRRSATQIVQLREGVRLWFWL